MLQVKKLIILDTNMKITTSCDLWWDTFINIFIKKNKYNGIIYNIYWYYICLSENQKLLNCIVLSINTKLLYLHYSTLDGFCMRNLKEEPLYLYQNTLESKSSLVWSDFYEGLAQRVDVSKFEENSYRNKLEMCPQYKEAPTFPPLSQNVKDHNSKTITMSTVWIYSQNSRYTITYVLMYILINFYGCSCYTQVKLFLNFD